MSNVPPAPEKRYWQRYIFLWIKYALWEELDAGDPERAREVRLMASSGNGMNSDDALCNSYPRDFEV